MSAKNTVHNDGVNYYVQTSEQGVALLRKGMPDSLLYNRGETFHLVSSIDTPNMAGGATPDLSKVIGAYGTGARPIIMWNQPHSIIAVEGFTVQNLIITQLDLVTDPSLKTWGVGMTIFPNGSSAKNVLIEDCRVKGYENNFDLENISNLVIRRNVILNACGLFRSQGIYLSTNKGILVEENFMESNGLRTCSDPTSGSGQAQNIYEQSDNKCLTVQGNIISNAHGNGLEARTGGVIQNNFFVNNNTHMNFCETLGGSTYGKVMPKYCGGDITGNVMIDGGLGMTVGNISVPTQISGNIFGQHSVHSAFLTIDSQNGVGVHGLTVAKNMVSSGKYFTSFQWGLPIGKVKLYNDGSQTQWQDCDGTFGAKDGLASGFGGLPVGALLWKYVSTPAPTPAPPAKATNAGCFNGLSMNGGDVWTDATPSVKVVDSTKTGIFMPPGTATVFYSAPNSFSGNLASVTGAPFEVSQTAWKTNPATLMPESADNLAASFVNPAWVAPASLVADITAQSHTTWNPAATAAALISQAQAAYKGK